MFSPTHPYLLPINPASSSAKPLIPLFEKPWVFNLSLIPSRSLIFPLSYTRLSFPQDSTPLFSPRPVPPGATYPQVLPTLQASGPAFPPPKEGGGRRERDGTPQGKDDLPLVLIAANRSFLLSYWPPLLHSPPSSSDRARPPPLRPRPTQTGRGDPGLGR